MVCIILTLILACVASLQACPEPMNVHIQNYEGPIILHTANGDNQALRNLNNQCPGNCANQCSGTCGNQQLGYYGNQYKQPVCYETECTCVSKHNYAPYAYGSVASYGSGCCSVADAKPMVYCVCNSYGNNGYSNNCGGNKGYQAYPNCQGKYTSC